MSTSEESGMQAREPSGRPKTLRFLEDEASGSQTEDEEDPPGSTAHSSGGSESGGEGSCAHHSGDGRGEGVDAPVQIHTPESLRCPLITFRILCLLIWLFPVSFARMLRRLQGSLCRAACICHHFP